MSLNKTILSPIIPVIIFFLKTNQKEKKAENGQKKRGEWHGKGGMHNMHEKPHNMHKKREKTPKNRPAFHTHIYAWGKGLFIILAYHCLSVYLYAA